MNVFTLMASLVLDKRSFDQGLAGAERQATQADKRIGSSLAGVGSAFTKVGGLALKFAGVLGLVASAASSGFGIKLAADAEATEVAFTTMLQSGEKAKKLLEDLNKFAADTPFQFPELSSAAKNLAAFGITAENIIPTLGRIGDIASGVGAPLGELAEIYGKMRIQQTLYAEDLNQLTGRGIPVIQEFAKQFGVTESQVKKLASEGKISFKNLEEAFISLTSEGGQFFNMMDAQSKTLLGKWSTFTDNFSQLLKRIGQRIIDTFDLKSVLDQATNLLEQWGPTIEQGVQRFLNQIRALFIGFKVLIENATNVLRSAYENNFLGIRTAVDWFAKHVGTRIAQVIEFTNKLASNTDLLATTYRGVFGGIAKILQGFAKVAQGYLVDPIVNIGLMWKDAFTQLSTMVGGWVDSLGKILGVDLAAVFGSAGSSAVDYFAAQAVSAFESLVGAAQAYADTNENVQEGLKLISEGWSESGAAVTAATDAMKNQVETVTKEVDALSTSSTNVQTPLADTATAIEDIGTKADKAANKISSGLLVTLAKLKGFEVTSGGSQGIINIVPQIKVDTSKAREYFFKLELEAAQRGWRELERALVNQQAALNERIKEAYDTAYSGWRQSEQQLVREQAAVDERTQAAYDEAVSGWRELEQQLVRQQAAVLEAAKSAYDEAVKAWRESERALVNRQEAIKEAQQKAYDEAVNGWRQSEQVLVNRQTAIQEAIEKAYDTAVSGWRDSEQDLVRQQAAVDEAAKTFQETLASLINEGMDKLRSESGVSGSDYKFDTTGGKNRNPDFGTEEATQKVKTFGDALLELAVNKIPGLGNVIAGFQNGPVAGVVAIFSELLSRSSAFSGLLEAVTNLLQPLADALNPLISVATDVITALQPVIEVVGALMQAGLAPLVAVLRNVVVPVFTFVGNIIKAVWNAIASVIPGLEKIEDADPRAGKAKPGSIDFYEENLQRYREAYEKATTDAERAMFKEQIDILEKKIAELRGENQSSSPGLGERLPPQGSIAYYQNLLKVAREGLENATNDAERKKFLDQIKYLEETINRLSGKVEDIKPSEPKAPITGGLFGDGSEAGRKISGASASIATAVVGISDAMMASIMAPIVNNTGQLVTLFQNAMNGDAAKIQMQAATLQVQAAQIQMNAAQRKGSDAVKLKPNWMYLQAMGTL
jgi:tape measure domain-containing protein